MRGLRGVKVWLTGLRAAGHPHQLASYLLVRGGGADNLLQKTEGLTAFGSTDSQDSDAQTSLRIYQPSPIRTIPSAPALHRILLANRQARGLRFNRQ